MVSDAHRAPRDPACASRVSTTAPPCRHLAPRKLPGAPVRRAVSTVHEHHGQQCMRCRGRSLLGGPTSSTKTTSHEKTPRRTRSRPLWKRRRGHGGRRTARSAPQGAHRAAALRRGLCQFRRVHNVITRQRHHETGPKWHHLPAATRARGRPRAPPEEVASWRGDRRPSRW